MVHAWIFFEAGSNFSVSLVRLSQEVVLQLGEGSRMPETRAVVPRVGDGRGRGRKGLQKPHAGIMRK